MMFNFVWTVVTFLVQVQSPKSNFKVHAKSPIPKLDTLIQIEN